MGKKIRNQDQRLSMWMWISMSMMPYEKSLKQGIANRKRVRWDWNVEMECVEWSSGGHTQQKRYRRDPCGMSHNERLDPDSRESSRHE